MDLDFSFFPAPKEISTEHDYEKYYGFQSIKNYIQFFKLCPSNNQKKRCTLCRGNQNLKIMSILSLKNLGNSQITKVVNVNYNQSLTFLVNLSPSDRDSRQTSEINSLSFDSNEGSPDVSYKLQQLNMQSIQIPSKKSQLCRKISNFYPQTKPKKNFCFSQPLIKLPKQLLDKKKENFVFEEPTVHRSNSRESNHIFGHIPCMYEDSKIHSPNIILYFHANCQDITQSYQFLIHLRDNLNVFFIISTSVSAIAMEYPGYGKYKNEYPNAEFILKDAEYVYNYLTKRLGYNENRIIIFGRSIGSGPHTQIASKYKPACLALMSPFTSLKAAVRAYVGSWAQYLIRQLFENLDQIKKVKIPTFILHGKAYNIIPYTQAQELYKNCVSCK